MPAMHLQTVPGRLFGHPTTYDASEVALIDANANKDGKGIITYAQLHDSVQTLARLFKPDEKVAIVLPNSVEFVVVFLAVLYAGATAAPLNPKYTKGEFDFSLTDIKASHLVVPSNKSLHTHPAFQAAKELKRGTITVLQCPLGASKLDSLHNERGEEVAMHEAKQEANMVVSRAQPDQVALLLHTSGTTGKPKLVPLLQKNLVAGAENVAKTLRLSAKQRSYALQVFFHIHGIQATLLAPLISGGGIVVPPAIDASKAWFEFQQYGCQWLTATPSILQILLGAPLPPEGVNVSFLRSCSSPLLPTTHAALERRFDCPVIEAYAMTEAAHQMASNTMEDRTSGSVGFAQGCARLAIVNEARNEFLPKGHPGEVAVSGENVTPGYVGREEANAKAFFADESGNRWFRTGDRGQMNANGRISLLGRFSEIINRGGEKISPAEVDEALMLASDKIKEAACFAVPDAFFGQEVEAAVVLQANTPSSDPVHTQDGIKDLVQSRLAEFKIPKRIHFCQDKIPKGPTGKIQRNVLTKLFAKPSTDDDGNEQPASVKQADVCSWLSTILPIGDRSSIDRNATLIDLGADSASFARLSRIATQAGFKLDIFTLFANPTVSALQQILDNQRKKDALQAASKSEKRAKKEHFDEERRRIEAIQDEDNVRKAVKRSQLAQEDVERILPLSSTQSYLAHCAGLLNTKPAGLSSNVFFQRDRIRIRQGFFSIDEWKAAWQETVRLEPSLRSRLLFVPDEDGKGEWMQVITDSQSPRSTIRWHSVDDEKDLQSLQEGLRHRSADANTIEFAVRIASSPSDPSEKPAFDFFLFQSHLFTEGQTRQLVLQTLLDILHGNQGKAHARATEQASLVDFIASTSSSSFDRADAKAMEENLARRKERFWSPVNKSMENVFHLHMADQKEEEVINAVGEQQSDIQGDWRSIAAYARTTVPMLIEAIFSLSLEAYVQQSQWAGDQSINRVVFDRAISGRKRMEWMQGYPELKQSGDSETLRSFTGGYLPAYCLTGTGTSSLVEYVGQYAEERRLEESTLPLEQMFALACHTVKFTWRLLDHSTLSGWSKIVDEKGCDVQMATTSFYGCHVTAGHPSNKNISFSIAQDEKWTQALHLKPDAMPLHDIFASSLQALARASTSEQLTSLTSYDLQLVQRVQRDQHTSTTLTPHPSAKREIVPLHQAFFQTAHRCPFHPAFQLGHSPGKSTTFQDLNANVFRLISTLQHTFAHLCNTRIALLTPFHDQDSVACALAIMAIGSTYVPLDPAYPTKRLQYQLTKVNASALIVSETLALDLFKDLTGSWETIPLTSLLSSALTMNDLTSSELHRVDIDREAHILFTSGSTGPPKASITTHRQACEAYRALQEAYGLRSTDRMFLYLSPSFDGCNADLFSALFAGSTVVTSKHVVGMEPNKLSEELLGLQASHALLTPALLASMSVQALRSLRFMGVGSERLHPFVTRQMVRDCASTKIVSIYGLHETGAINVMYDVRMMDERGDQDEEPIPLGFPFGYNSVFILDPHANQTLAHGVQGEIALGGPQIGNGYLDDEERTSEKITLRGTKRLFRTGDLGFIRQDGALMFSGRADAQISYRGLRIEPGEVESLAADVQEVINSVLVHVQPDGDLSQRLILFLLCTSHQCDNAHEHDAQYLWSSEDADKACRSIMTTVHEHLKRNLLSFSLPHHYIFLRQMPRTPNGKRDRKALVGIAHRLICSNDAQSVHSPTESGS